MSDDATRGFNLPWPTVLTVITAALGAVVYFQPLNSSRPAVEPDPLAKSLGYQDVPARLWQDPFKAVRDWNAGIGKIAQASNGTTYSHELSELAKQINARKPEGNLLVLIAMVSGGPYAETAEQRLRTRVALLGGLARAGYESESSDHIGFVEVPWLNKIAPDTRSQEVIELSLQEGNKEVLPVPYEWAHTGAVKMAGVYPLTPSVRYKNVLLMWLDEDLVADRPLGRLVSFLMHLGRKVQGWPPSLNMDVALASPDSIPAVSPPRDDGITIKIVGPQVSSTLRAMVEESYSSKYDFTGMPLKGITAYSSTATASDKILLRDTSGSKPPWQSDRGDANPPLSQLIEKQGGGLRLIRTTRTDRYVMDVLVDELRLRLAPQRRSLLRPVSEYVDDSIPAARIGGRPSLAADLGHIAIISEWETFYGRALPISFASAVSGHSVESLMTDTEETWPNTIHTSVYLRGIDGKIPGSDPNANGRSSGSNYGNSSSSDSKTSALLSRSDERPEGVSQADYLRRLADELAELDTRIRHSQAAAGGTPFGKEGLRAIGILGTDLYDKLLVLRALRSRFPGLVFFTTSVDARYELSSEWATVHNLVVVAPFDLMLDENYQGGVPPFRDSYQTAVFASTLAALGVVPALDPPANHPATVDLEALGTPRRFEVGRSGLVDLTIDTAANGDVSIQPVRPFFRLADLQDPKLWLAVVTVAFGIICLIVLGARPEKSRWSQFWGFLRQIIWPVERWRYYGAAFRKTPHTTLLFVGLLLSVVTTFFLILLWGSDGKSGQPLLLFDGVSSFPTTLIRSLVFIISVCLIIKTFLDRDANNRELCRWFRLKSLHQSKNGKNKPYLVSPKPTLFYSGWAVYGYCLPGRVPVDCDPTPGKQVYAQSLWWEYQRRSKWWIVMLRALIGTAIYFGIVFILFSAGLPAPKTPVRGLASEWAQFWVLVLSVVSSVFLLFMVLDSSYINRKFISYLARRETHWPIDAHYAFQKRSKHWWNIGYEEMTEYMDIRFIAMRTNVVGRAIYYPFLVIVLMIFARSPIFGDWDWPTGLFVIFGCNLLLAFLGAYMLRSVAEEARVEALARVKGRYLRNLAQTTGKNTAEVLDRIYKAIEKESQGAFQILSHYPLLASILLPTSGLGIWVLLDYLAKSGGR